MNDTKTPDTLLTEGPISGKIIRYALPIFIGYLFQQFYNTADAIIVGNLIGSSALAAVTGTGAIVFMAVGFFLGFSIGAGIVIARRIGAQDHERTASAVHTTVAMGIAFSVLMTAAGVLLTPGVLRLMGTPDDVFPEASLYL
ncbi:MAG: MATE family efflux transporter, partial [Oscillospiraceae bacterium]|nr:MATE family efflux transporter [Oscillospiraceae bacterium]